jgi:cathepsin L
MLFISFYVVMLQEETCKFNKSAIVAKVTGYGDLPKSEKALMTAVATIGPISAALDATQRSFQLYKSGVYDEPNCKQQVDHSLVVVGYGVQGDKKYWIAKNRYFHFNAQTLKGEAYDGTCVCIVYLSGMQNEL